MSCHVSVSPIVQGKSKVKLTLKQALKDHMGRYTSTLSLTFDTRLGEGESMPSHFTHENDPLPIAQEAGLVLGLAGQWRKSRPYRDSILGASSP